MMNSCMDPDNPTYEKRLVVCVFFCEKGLPVLPTLSTNSWKNGKSDEEIRFLSFVSPDRITGFRKNDIKT